VRLEGASFDRSVPAKYERNACSGQKRSSGGENYYMVSLNPIFKVSPNLSLFAAGQYGTALNPTQGGNVTSEANFAETGLMEGGIKVSLLDNTLYASAAVYYATGERFDNFAGASFGVREYIHTQAPGFRFAATQGFYTPMLAGTLYPDFGDNNGLVRKNNPERRVPGAPERTANLLASFALGGGFEIAIGPSIRQAYWHTWEHTLRLPSTVIRNGNGSFKRGPVEVLLPLTNIGSEDYFTGSEGFAANTIITKAPSIEGKLNVVCKFRARGRANRVPSAVAAGSGRCRSSVSFTRSPPAGRVFFRGSGKGAPQPAERSPLMVLPGASSLARMHHNFSCEAHPPRQGRPDRVQASHLGV
jgi:hypothetical protein